MSHQAQLIQGRCQAEGAQAAAARACRVSLANFYQWYSGRRPVPVAKGALIERALGLPRWELWPDCWHVIWPELVGTEGSPQVPAPELSAADA